MTLLLRNIIVQSGNFRLEVDIELHGKICGIFGPSGAGKTTLLETIAGLRRPLSAWIRQGDRVLSNTADRIYIPTEHRAIGYVPQDLALFPHLSVEKNLLFGWKGDGKSADAILHVAKVLEIESLLQRSILPLSGGEKQRVAFARAILASPSLLLLDEPLTSLDRPIKQKMTQYLIRLRDEFKIPMIYVSHDPDEIVELCDEVVFLENGRATRQGSPRDHFVPDSKPRYVELPPD